MNQSIILLLALTCSLPVHAASEKPSWPIRIEHDTFDTSFDTSGNVHTLASYTESIYYIQKNLPEPHNPTKTLGDFCQQAHAYNLPWCFLIARIKNMAPNGEVTTRTRYFDAATMYTSLYKLEERPAWADPRARWLELRTLLIQKFALFILEQELCSRPIHVTATTFNHYPDGLTTVINHIPELDRLGLQLDYTTQYRARKWPVANDSETFMIGSLTLSLLADYLSGQENSENARNVALFWYNKCRRNALDYYLTWIEKSFPDAGTRLQKPSPYIDA